MNQNKIVNLLNRVLKSNGTKLKKLDEYMYWSPFVSHHKPKLQINVRTQKWHCWVSNVGGRTLFQLFKKVSASHQHFDELRELVGDSPRYKKKTDTKADKVVQLPNEYKPLWNGGDSIVKRHALSYLYKRGITDSDILKYNIGYCDEGLYSNRIIIPSYDEDGKLNYFIARDIFPNSNMKYKNPPMSKDTVVFELFINWNEPIVLVEGSFDAIAVRKNVIPLLGKFPSKSLVKKLVTKKVKKVYVALDTDAKKDAAKLVKFLMDSGIEAYLLSMKEKLKSTKDLYMIDKRISKTEQSTFTDIIKGKLYG